MKKIISLILALAMCLSLTVFAFADNTDTAAGDPTTVGEEEPTRWEETQWYYRITGDGLFQRRLWSITYMKWLTDWETIGHV